MNCLPSRQFTCNVKHYFLWKLPRTCFENVVCQSWLALESLIWWQILGDREASCWQKRLWSTCADAQDARPLLPKHRTVCFFCFVFCYGAQSSCLKVAMSDIGQLSAPDSQCGAAITMVPNWLPFYFLVYRYSIASPFTERFNLLWLRNTVLYRCLNYRMNWDVVAQSCRDAKKVLIER